MLRHLVLIFSLVLAALSVGVGLRLERAALERSLPRAAVAPGVKLDGEQPDGDFEAAVHTRAGALAGREITLTFEGRPLTRVHLEELGLQADADFALAKAGSIAQTGSLEARAREARAAEGGSYDVALPTSLPVEALAERLLPFKEEIDTRARAAKRKLNPAEHKDEISPHANGRYLDVYATAEAVLRAALRGEDSVDVATFSWVPDATGDAVRAADVSTLVGNFETRFGGPPGRDLNITTATSRLDGLVLMPGETISFNDEVGPRTEENGFHPAPEIYKGEIREGIGGGACQVASTFYAAAFFAGLDVLERRNHSRPSAYIRTGLDATVSFPVLDLRIKNPFDFPIVVAARAEQGKMRFELWGRARQVEVELATATKGILKYTRKLERHAGLPAGEFRVKQRGKRGMQLRRLKTVRNLGSGAATVEESVDTYPPQQEVVIAAPDVKDADLPPLEPPADGGA